MINIGERIGELRKRAGYTQKELAEKLNVTVQMVSKWETGAAAPDVYMVSEIADAFGVSTDAVIGHGTESGYGADKVYEELKEIFISRIAYTNEAFEKYGWTPEAKRERAADVVKAMHENPLSAVGSINPEKLFYGSEDTGFVMMDDKDKTLFPEKSDALFDFLGNKTNRLILNFIHEHIYSGPISNVYIAESLGITTEEADVCLDFLKNNYMLTEKKSPARRRQRTDRILYEEDNVFAKLRHAPGDCLFRQKNQRRRGLFSCAVGGGLLRQQQQVIFRAKIHCM